jgi:hypothetical protein
VVLVGDPTAMEQSRRKGRNNSFELRGIPIQMRHGTLVLFLVAIP